MRMLELFTGCGGLARGMQEAGFEHAAFVEFNHDACESLRLNYPADIVHEVDVRNFDFRLLDSIDAIAGGPPCQPFSLGGLAKGNNDARDMFPQAARAIKEVSPRGFLFENVKGLLRKSFADYFSYTILRLTFPTEVIAPGEDWHRHYERLQRLSFPDYRGLKYRVEYRLVNAADYGVPQVRERVVIVGIRSDVERVWEWPEPTTTKEEWRTVRQALAGVRDPRDPSNRIKDHVFVDGARIYPGHTGSDIDKPSKTIKAGGHGVPGGENMLRFEDGSVRYMTVYEAKRIQTFPRDYRISGSWGEAMRQIGNAVPVELARIMGQRLLQTLA